jgi:hypothetical protein
MNALTDQFDAPTAAAPDTGEMGRTFTFGGIKLNQFSWVHAMAFWRLVGTPVSNIERAVILLYLLTQDDRTVNAVRTRDEEDDFRLKAIKWAQAQGLGKGVFNKEAMEIAAAIEKDLDKAQSVEPDSAGGAGNG